MGLALDLEDCHPSVLLHCWLGHLTCKIVSEMTYNVSSGTLNPHTCCVNVLIAFTEFDHGTRLSWADISAKLSPACPAKRIANSLLYCVLDLWQINLI